MGPNIHEGHVYTGTIWFYHLSVSVAAPHNLIFFQFAQNTLTASITLLCEPMLTTESIPKKSRQIINDPK